MAHPRKESVVVLLRGGLVKHWVRGLQGNLNENGALVDQIQVAFHLLKDLVAVSQVELAVDVVPVASVSELEVGSYLELADKLLHKRILVNRQLHLVVQGLLVNQVQVHVNLTVR